MKLASLLADVNIAIGPLTAEAMETEVSGSTWFPRSTPPTAWSGRWGGIWL